MIKSLSCWLSALLLLTVASAEQITDAMTWLSERAGGDTTVSLQNETAFAQPLANLPVEQLRTFTFGNRIFNTNWVVAPASVDKFDGLGPLFNRVSCSACHTRDGRGQPPSDATQSFESMLMRVSVPGSGVHGEPLPVPNYGEQLNERAIPGVEPEAQVRVSYHLQPGQYADGATYTLSVPNYQITQLAYGELPNNTLCSPRVAPPVFGLGLLEAVPDAVLLQLADPDDRNHDGISGRVNYVWDVAAAAQRIGRFGWKANQPSLLQQNAAAAHGDIGITTSLFAQQNVTAVQHAAASAPHGGEPEMTDEYLTKLTFYTQTLAPPAARQVEQPQVIAGARLFVEAGCGGCHVPTLTTGTATVAALSGQTIHAYTDLLLHDMGEALADHRPDYQASGSEWRTPPLWGIGLTAAVNRHTRFLHDGRARNVEEAILWHGGEAQAAQQRFVAMSSEQRTSLLRFLTSL